MLRKNTNEIIEMCRKISSDYDKQCNDPRDFLGLDAPGKEGVARKEKFERIVSTLQNNTPEEAFFKLYQFYKEQEKTAINSRLVDSLEKNLASLVGIKIYTVYGGRHGMGTRTVGRDDFLRLAEEIGKTLDHLDPVCEKSTSIPLISSFNNNAILWRNRRPCEEAAITTYASDIQNKL